MTESAKGRFEVGPNLTARKLQSVPYFDWHRDRDPRPHDAAWPGTTQARCQISQVRGELLDSIGSGDAQVNVCPVLNFSEIRKLLVKCTVKTVFNANTIDGLIRQLREISEPSDRRRAEIGFDLYPIFP